MRRAVEVLIHSLDRADQDFGRELLAGVPWREDTITLFGKTYPQPRLTALYGEGGKTYTYSGITMHRLPFTPLLHDLREAVAKESGLAFNTVLINLYRDGRDSNGWHADNEPELGPAPAIASLSVGAPRAFHLKHRHLKDQRCNLNCPQSWPRPSTSRCH